MKKLARNPEVPQGAHNKKQSDIIVKPGAPSITGPSVGNPGPGKFNEKQHKIISNPGKP